LTAVKAAEFQRGCAEVRAAEPEGDSKGEGAGAQVNNDAAGGKGQGKAGEQTAEAVEVPGEKVTKVRGKQGRLVQVGKAAFPAGAGKEPGEFRYITWQSRTEAAGDGESFFDKGKHSLQAPADSIVQVREKPNR
jgi:hypothetical protein